LRRINYLGWHDPQDH